MNQLKSDFSDNDHELPDPVTYEHHNIQVDKGQEPIRIDKYLSEKIPNVSRTKIKSTADAGLLHVNNLPIKGSYKVRPLDTIKVLLFHPPRINEVIPQNIPLDIVYEDADIIVVNKPSGMVVHPANGNWQDTLVNGLLYHCNNLPFVNKEQPRPGLIHRIDKYTSGLLVVAKTESAMVHLSKQFFYHTVKRIYLALVWGQFKEEEGTITGNIGRNPRDRKLMAVLTETDQGKPAITHYKVIKSFRYVSLIECKLETGRTHQIRVHMKLKGHPVFNDQPYGGGKILKGINTGKYKQFVTRCFEIMPYYALHAATIGFIHPDTGKELSFNTPLPDNFKQLLEMWEKLNV